MNPNADAIEARTRDRIGVLRHSVAIQRCASHSMVEHLERVRGSTRKSALPLATYARAIAWYEEAAFDLMELLPNDAGASSAAVDADGLRARMKATLDPASSDVTRPAQVME